jgi:hypothetical protein
MQLKQIGSNVTELLIHNDLSIVFSYETPVAGWDQDGPFKTEEFYSKTTTKHINKWFCEQGVMYKHGPRLVSQEYINQLVEG